MSTNDLLNSTKRVDLYRFLCTNHPDKITQEEDAVRLSATPDIRVVRRSSDYTDCGTNTSGSAVDLLVKYLGYSVEDAITILSQSPKVLILHRRGSTPSISRVTELPAKDPGKCSRLYGYLHGKGIPIETLRLLLKEKLVYQEWSPNKRIVFVNKAREYAEVYRSSTNDFYFGLYHPLENRCWYLRTGNHPTTAFICESAIDAVSLYLLRKKEAAYYVSIVADNMQGAIERIRDMFSLTKVVLAVNKTPSGDACRNKYDQLESIIPQASSWNEDLMKWAEENKVLSDRP